MTTGAKWGAFAGAFAYFSALGQFRLSFTFNYLLAMLFLGFLAGAAVVSFLNKEKVRFFRAGRNF